MYIQCSIFRRILNFLACLYGNLLKSFSIVDKYVLHFFSKVDKINNDVVVQQCFSNFKRGDKCNDYGFVVHRSLLAYIISLYRVYDKFYLQFQ